ncbi:kelch-like protein 10 [Melanaphis sacchari]|uniref:kelch-like protein 10 n=1 Tax=Melanaphis sacchari TaxID=742174 RepID=UPI000DC1301C|nr:kelch-like protein 10 [Melanaphis sacchari]
MHTVELIKKSDGEDSYKRRLTRQVSMHTLNGFNELRLNVKLCDASLILDNGDTFPIHRSVLSGSSDYFRILFTTTLHEEDYTKINLKSIESTTMELILQYIYMRQIDINYNNVMDIMRTADYLCIDGLVQLCHEFVIECLGPDNCVTLLQFAEYYYFEALTNAAYKYIIKEFMTIFEQGDELMKLRQEEFNLIIEDNQLNVKREEFVWDVVLKWVDRDPENRKNDLLFLLPKVRFGLMDSKYFIENVKDHHYIQNRDDCRPYIIETLKFMYDLQLTSNMNDSIAPMLARPRYPSEVLFAIGGWSGGSPTAIIETYDTKSDRWTRIFKEDPYGPRAYHGTIVMGHNIYIIGGFDGLEYFNSCRKFNTVTKIWDEVAPMNCKRCYVSVVLLNGIIYAMGGFDGHHRLGSAEKYNFERNQWTMIAPMTSQRSDACAAVMNGKIYITGGFNGQECMDTAETYNVETNEWTLIPAMRTRRSGVSCITYHNCLYVIGGFNGLVRMNSGEKFDPTTNHWSPVVDMCNPRSNFAVEVLDDMIFVAGGFNGVTTIAQVECYSDRTDEWFEAKNMQVYRSALSACVMRDLPNVEYYMPLDRDRLEEGRKNIVRNNRPNNNNDTERVDNESVNTVATLMENLQTVQIDDNDNVIIID